MKVPVAQMVVVRNLDHDVKRKLQDRARRHGLSTEEEVRNILRNAVKDEESPEAPLGSRLAARFKGIGLTDAQIAGITAARKATSATRNIKYFKAVRVPLVNPGAI
jgi:plasmid stability protein